MSRVVRRQPQVVGDHPHPDRIARGCGPARRRPPRCRLPAWPTLLGGSTSGAADIDPDRPPARPPNSMVGRVFELDPEGKAVAVKDRRLNQPQGRHRNAVPAVQQRGQVALDALFVCCKAARRFLAQLRQQVESELRVEDFFGSGWKESRLTVCCCSSSMPGVPRSLAGSKIWTTDARDRERGDAGGAERRRWRWPRDGRSPEARGVVGIGFRRVGQRGAHAGMRDLFGGEGEIDDQRRAVWLSSTSSDDLGGAGEDHHGGLLHGFGIEPVRKAGALADRGKDCRSPPPRRP